MAKKASPAQAANRKRFAEMAKKKAGSSKAAAKKKGG
jgi:hypothetical protein